MIHWFLIIIGTMIIALGLSKEFFLLFKSLFNIKNNWIKYNKFMRVSLIFFGFVSIFFGLYAERIN